METPALHRQLSSAESLAIRSGKYCRDEDVGLPGYVVEDGEVSGKAAE